MQSCHIQWQVSFVCPYFFVFFFLKSVETCRLCVIFVISTCYGSWLLGCANWNCLGDSRESLFWGMKMFFPVQLFLSGVIHFWKAEVTGSFAICTSGFSNMYKWLQQYVQVMPWNYISKRCVFALVRWPWRLLEEWPEACSNLTVVGAGAMHGFGTDPIRKPTFWLAESWNQES